jgi:hypothetical protein
MKSTPTPANKRKDAPVFDPSKTAEAEAVKKKPGKTAAAASKPKENKTAGPQDSAQGTNYDALELPFEVYHLAKGDKYYWKDEAGRFQPHGVEDFRRLLRLRGISGKNADGELTSAHDHLIQRVQSKHGLDVAMPLAGYGAGLREMNGVRLLVTVPPKLPQPQSGDFPALGRLLSELAGVGKDDDGDIQLKTLTLWLARAWRSIAENRTLSGHCLILAGPPSACKTLFQEVFITAILGGRKAKAALVLVKDKDFTADLASSEHLYLADELVSKDYRARMNLAEKIKSFVANRGQSVHPKGVDQMTLDPRWRLSISLNDEPDRLAMLPPLDDPDIADKVILLRCYPVTRPSDDLEQEKWIKQLIEEIPAFLHDALGLQVPDELREQDGVRFGFRSFQHPGLMAEMHANESESTAMAVIDKLLFWSPDPVAIEDSASNIRLMMLDKVGDNRSMRAEVDRLFPNESRAGSTLGRIMIRYPGRVEKPDRHGNKRFWRILPPAEGQAS